MSSGRTTIRVEYGDFQTPQYLAEQVCRQVASVGITARSVVEPTCGAGSFLVAALRHFKGIEHLVGTDINPSYIQTAKSSILNMLDQSSNIHVDITVADFFVTDWDRALSELAEPILFLGNPPWVTNSELSVLNSTNLPFKRNSQGLSGIEAITGASNFDISEWMLLRMIDFIDRRSGAIAMLCKTSVARKVLLHLWRRRKNRNRCFIFRFDATRAFDVSVDACLFILDGTRDDGRDSCLIYDSFHAATPSQHIGFRNDTLVSDVDLFDRWSHLVRTSKRKPTYQWRSGIKHDASSVMELTKVEGGYRNQLGEIWALEDRYLSPMLKSSDISGSVRVEPRLWMLVTQRRVGDETASIQISAPTTWQYLNSHAEVLDRRKSRIYHNRPRFSVFGVGDYSFSPWKIVISGMYRELVFKIVGSYEGKPIVLDDTCYFIPCSTQNEASFLADILNSNPAREYYSSLIFWDDKRPITIGVLKTLDIEALAQELGVRDRLIDFHCKQDDCQQLSLLGN